MKDNEKADKLPDKITVLGDIYRKFYQSRPKKERQEYIFLLPDDSKVVFEVTCYKREGEKHEN